MKIAVIDNYDSFVYNLVRYLNELNDECTIVQRNDKINFDELASADAILLSPGPGIPKEAGALFEVIDRFHASTPILGVCLGHQALGEYFGAELIQNEAPVHGKSSEVRHNFNSPLFADVPEKFDVGRYHSWSILNTVPDTLTTTAITENEQVMAMDHIRLPISGVQFHPESILTPEGRKIIANWVNTIPPKMN